MTDQQTDTDMPLAAAGQSGDSSTDRGEIGLRAAGWGSVCWQARSRERPQLGDANQ